MIKDNIKIIKEYFKLVKGSRLWITILFFSSIMVHVFSLIIPIFASNIVYYVTNGDVNATYMNILMLFIMYAFYNFCMFLHYKAHSYNFNYSYKKLRERILDKVSTFDLDFQNRISKSKILNTVNHDCAPSVEMIDHICEIIVMLIKLVVSIIIFLKTNIFIGIFALILEFLYIKSFDYCNIKSTKYLRKQMMYRDKLTDNLSEILNGLNEIKVYNLYSKIKNKYYIVAERWSKAYLSKRKYNDVKYSILPFITHVGKVILYLILVNMTFKGNIKVNMLILLISYFEETMKSTDEIMKCSDKIREWSVSIYRVNKLLNYKNINKLSFGDNELDEIEGIVKFKNVNFTYKQYNKGSVKNINLIIKPNEITALVGHSGSGKTTLTNLLLRKNKIDSGKILIDGQDIYDYSKKIYSKNVVGVSQSPFIFDMSIRQNLGLIDSNVSNQIEACKRVGIHDYIMSLPKGYNTLLSDNTSDFFGGQKQLLAIARTLLSKAEILIFDEVTSSLDTVLVDKIKEIFDDLKLDHTIIIITHKKDVMKIADKIVVLNKGKIVGMGTHDELMKDNSYYIDLQTNNYSSSHPKLYEEEMIIKEENEFEK